MRWVDLAFLHWRLPPGVLRPLIPVELQLDTFRDEAWVGITPFEMRDVRALSLLSVPTASNFPELNVRTYVRYRDRPGVYFFSLDAGSRLAVIGARLATNLPYYHARMRVHRAGGARGEVQYQSVRRHPGAWAAEFRARYRPTGSVYAANPDSLEYWLTERYSLYVKSPLKNLTRLDIEHARWPLQPAEAHIVGNTMAIAAGISLPNDAPLVHFASQLDVVAHWPLSAH
jgi:uncharacterized protein YqjF (DUF2071 family)